MDADARAGRWPGLAKCVQVSSFARHTSCNTAAAAQWQAHRGVDHFLSSMEETASRQARSRTCKERVQYLAQCGSFTDRDCLSLSWLVAEPRHAQSPTAANVPGFEGPCSKIRFETLKLKARKGACGELKVALFCVSAVPAARKRPISSNRSTSSALDIRGCMQAFSRCMQNGPFTAYAIIEIAFKVAFRESRPRR